MYKRNVREIEGLRWARFIETPAWLKNTRHRGTAAKGKAYERKVLAKIGRLVAENKLAHLVKWLPAPWIEFEDAHGPGIAQPDGLIIYSDVCVVVEVKLKQSPVAERQIKLLYGPLAERLTGKPITGLEVFKYVRKRQGDAAWFYDLLDIDFAGKIRYFYLHHMGL